MDDLLVAAREVVKPDVLFSHNSMPFGNADSTFNPNPDVMIKPKLEHYSPTSDNNY
jgi:hypothetical protein